MQKDIKNAMKRYIAKTDLNAHGFIRYDMVVKEVQCLYEIGRYEDIGEALYLAFRYGASKGYRCAMKNATQQN